MARNFKKRGQFYFKFSVVKYRFHIFEECEIHYAEVFELCRTKKKEKKKDG